MRTVIACSDGAIRGGYIAGAFLALKEHCPAVWDSVTDLTASSASVGGLFYEECFGVKNPGEKLWTKDFADPALIKFSNFFSSKGMYDIAYLAYTILKQNNPCDIVNIHHSKYGYYFPLIDHDSGKTVIFNNRGLVASDPMREFRLIEPDHLYDYIHAAAAAPILYDKAVQIGKHRYIDAAIRVPYFLDDSLFGNHKRIVISAKNPFDYSSDAFICKVLGNCYYHCGGFLGANLDTHFYQEIANKPQLFQKTQQAILNSSSFSNTFYIYPQQPLGGLFDNSRQTLQKNFATGERDLIQNIQKLQAFMSQ